MKHSLKIQYFLVIALFSLSGCGIDGFPLSPAQVKSQEKFNPLSPFDKSPKQPLIEQSQEPDKFTSIYKLNLIGYDYNANFGLENDELDDMFLRLAPASARAKRRRAIIKLDHE